MSALKPIFEEFSDGSSGAVGGLDVRTQRIKATAFDEGFAAGKAAQEALQNADNDFFTKAAEEMNAALIDLPARLNEQLGETLISVLQKVLPALAKEGFARETSAAILNHADLSDPGSVVIKVSEDRVVQLTKALAEQGADKELKIEIDPALAGSTISVFWKNAGLELDIDQAVVTSLASLENFMSQFREERTNDK